MFHLRCTTLLALVLSLAIPSERSAACVMSFPEHEVGRNFGVEITYNGRPLEGIEIEISRETHEEPYLVVVKSNRSDAKGRSFVSGLNPGSYFLVVRHAGVEGEAAELKVVADDQRDRFVEDELRFSWPNKKVFKVRQLAGTLVRTPFDFRKRVAEPPLAGAKLTLIDALPATELRTFAIASDGRFSFRDLKDGLYIVHVKQDKKVNLVGYLEEEIDGNIFVEIVANATDEQIPLLRLYMSDCGMGMRGKDGSEMF